MLVTSSQQRDELLAVLSWEKFRTKYGVTPADRRRLADRLDRSARFVQPVEPYPVAVRDPTDEAILATAIIGSADYLVTGDADLQVLAGDTRLGSLQIVTPRSFLEILDTHSVSADSSPTR